MEFTLKADEQIALFLIGIFGSKEAVEENLAVYLVGVANQNKYQDMVSKDYQPFQPSSVTPKDKIV